MALADNVGLLEGVRARLVNPASSVARGIGLRGMGGECVCQIYLSRFHEHIVRNPWIQARKHAINWKFWDLHVGEHDVEHRLRTRKLIDEEIVSEGGAELQELELGYRESMTSWGQFWANIFASVKGAGAPRVRVARTIDLRPKDVERTKYLGEPA